MVPVIRPSDRNMSLIRHIGTLRTRSFTVGVVLGLVNGAYAQSGTDHRVPAHPPASQLALDQWPTVAGRRRQPTAEEIDRRIRARHHPRRVGAPRRG